MVMFARGSLLAGALLATTVIRGGAPATAPAAQPQVQVQVVPGPTVACPYGFYYGNGFCRPYSWTGAAMTGTRFVPTLPP